MGAWALPALLLLCAGAARAMDSESAHYQNTRSEVDGSGSGGGSNNGQQATMIAAAYTNIASLGEVAATTTTVNQTGSADYTQRAGLPGIYEYPGTVTGFAASSGTTIGSIFLQWTAPGNDAYASGTKAKDFVIAYSSIAAQSPAVSTANWYAALAAGGFVGSVPAPQNAGTMQTMTVNGLTAGVTYYFAIEGQEADGLYGPLSQGATAVATIGVSPITNLTASTTTVIGDIRLTWTAPTYFGGNPPLSYVIKVSTLNNINTETDFNNALQLSQFSSSTIPTPLAGGSTQGMTVTGLTSCQEYYFAIAEEDSGAPPSVGQWSRSLSSAPPAINYFNFSTPGCSAPDVPMEPINIALSTGMSVESLVAHNGLRSNGLVLVATISWSPVTMFWNGTSFSNPNAPSNAELSDYRVQWTSAPVPNPQLYGYSWTDLPGMPLSTGTLAYVDVNMAADCPQSCFYQVLAENPQGQSLPSNLRNTGSGDLWAVLSDTTPGQAGVTTMDMPSSFANGLTNYYVQGKVHPEDYSSTGEGPIIQSIEFDAMLNGVTLDSSMRLSGAANLIIYYPVDFDGNPLSPSAALRGNSAQPHASSTADSNLSMFWWDGNGWIQAYGKIETSNVPASNDLGMAYLQTAFLGKYQLRAAEVPTGFSFDPSGLTNRFITPNGDGKNDNAVFNFANPEYSNVTGKIFDMQGRYVADMTAPPATYCADGAPGQCLMWDGRGSNGTIVSGGVYVYQITAEGHSYNGTLVVIK